MSMASEDDDLDDAEGDEDEDAPLTDEDRRLMEEGLAEFDAELDEYMEEWEDSLRAGLQSAGEEAEAGERLEKEYRKRLEEKLGGP
jgi:hypothetical protein